MLELTQEEHREEVKRLKRKYNRLFLHVQAVDEFEFTHLPEVIKMPEFQKEDL